MPSLDITPNSFNTTAFKSQLERLSEVAEEIAQTKLRPNAERETPPIKQPQEPEEPVRAENPPQEQARQQQQSEFDAEPDAVSDLAENIVEMRQISHNVKALANAIKTADEMLGTIIDLRA